MLRSDITKRQLQNMDKSAGKKKITNFFFWYNNKMGNIRDNRIALLEAHSLNVINDEEFLLLYDINSSRNPDLPYWNYERFI